MTIAERVAASRESQGLPPTIENTAVLENIAYLLANDERLQRSEGAEGAAAHGRSRYPAA